MMLIEMSNTKKEVKLYLDKIIERKEMFNQEQKEFLITIIQLVLKKQLGEEKADEFIYKLRREEKNMLAVLEMIDRENARIRKEGRKEGKLESKLQIVKNMLKEQFTLSMISKITGLKISEIEKIKKNMKELN